MASRSLAIAGLIRLRLYVKLSAWLGQSIEVGKFAPGLLRPPTDERNDLADALGSVKEERTAIESTEVTFALVGEVQEMQLVVRNEIYRIGYGAIRNAYEAQPTAAEVRLVLALSRVNPDNKPSEFLREAPWPIDRIPTCLRFRGYNFIFH